MKFSLEMTVLLKMETKKKCKNCAVQGPNNRHLTLFLIDLQITAVAKCNIKTLQPYWKNSYNLK